MHVGFRMVSECSGRDVDYLLIAEKPKAAKAIADALSPRPRKCGGKRGVPYWVLSFEGSKVMIVPSAGHLFSLDTRKRGVPVFEYEWKPRYLVEKGARHTARFYRLLERMRDVGRIVVNACDYDVEGSVIGYHIISFILGRRMYYRMKFSSLTGEELRRSFRNLLPPDTNMVESGLCRHELDWIWGINSSRLLMKAYEEGTGRTRVLSAGRVQTPTLLEAIKGYLRSVAELPLPEYMVEATFKSPEGHRLRATHVNSPFRERAQASHVARNTPKNCILSKVVEREEKIPPPTPFNLNDLQSEAYRIYRFSPLKTQKVAEDLYLDGLISYPRTNSQRIPPTVNVSGILRSLEKLGYGEEVRVILSLSNRPWPRQGRKTDPAHPAIYPTGKPPKKLGDDAKKLYDLVVRRFLASMMEPGVKASIRYEVTCRADRFTGDTLYMKERGWTSYYPWRGREGEWPGFAEGTRLALDRARVVTRLAKKHKRYTKASLLEWMEKTGIGTEATRAPIMETLFKRGYLREKKAGIEPTPLGLAVAIIVESFFPMLTDVELTRLFEEKVEMVREGKARREAIVGEARGVVSRLVNEAIQSLSKAGRMMASYMDSGKVSASCPLCGLPATESGLCIIHKEGMDALTDRLPEWMRREGLDREGALRKVASSKQVGEAVREVARAVLEGRLIL